MKEIVDRTLATWSKIDDDQLEDDSTKESTEPRTYDLVIKEYQLAAKINEVVKSLLSKAERMYS